MPTVPEDDSSSRAHQPLPICAFPAASACNYWHAWMIPSSRLESNELRILPQELHTWLPILEKSKNHHENRSCYLNEQLLVILETLFSLTNAVTQFIVNIITMQNSAPNRERYME